MHVTATIGFALTGSYCTFSKVLPQMEHLMQSGYRVIPILSEHTAFCDTRFGTAEEYTNKIRELTGEEILCSLPQVEPIGPKRLLDLLLIAPCTGNTIAKLANGIADTSVTLAVKSHLRNNRPVVIAISTNDGLGANARNIGTLLARKHVYMVPFGQDDCIDKENSLVAHFDLIEPTVVSALNGKQLQPVLV
ncbi:MAG: dipicolinate synthase subunit B [Clostridia bacterium]|nr:dipicolinate synthase subunit B [Clostridia bacterium]